jgi:XTP/dITP diphosphohydrolase
MKTLLIATRNAHKVGEIRAILGPAFAFLTLDDFPAAPTVVEDADTFAGNARKKAAELAAWVAGRRPPPDYVLADDSGLEVDALAGAPGVHSARFAALDGAAAATGNSPDADNNAKLLRLLAEVPPVQRTARFRCVIALMPVADPAAAAQVFEGACEGRIQSAASGRGGFGYDPLFIPDGFAQSFAELGEDVKNRLSHRARALAGLQAFLGRSAAVPAAAM